MVTGVVMAGVIASPAFAWHPKGIITKYVQNVSASGEKADANDTASAVSAKPGDTLKYTIVVQNNGDTASNGNNDMHYVKLTDTLPAGVELVSDASKRTIKEDLGILKPGQKATKEYLVKVTSQVNGDVIKNTACFTGDSEVKDNPQAGCDPAVITVSVPPKTPEPPKETPKQPEPPKEQPKELVNTGPGNFLVPAGIAASLGYAGNLLRLKLRANKRQS
jgi:uncharacterized repeat protein (TIGR01451 family)